MNTPNGRYKIGWFAGEQPLLTPDEKKAASSQMRLMTELMSRRVNNSAYWEAVADGRIAWQPGVMTPYDSMAQPRNQARVTKAIPVVKAKRKAR